MILKLQPNSCKMNDVITKKHYYSHPIGAVWNAISDAKEISSWFIQADFRPEEGYDYTFKHEDTVIKGKVLKANPVYELVYTWVVGDTEVETVVSWKLSEKDGGTELILEHSGISNYPGETAVVMFTNFNGGWQSCIENLEQHLRK